MGHPGRYFSKFFAAIALPLLLLPLALLVALQADQTHSPDSVIREHGAISTMAPHRVVVVIVDSLRPTLVDAETMPYLASLTQHAYDLKTCQANFTLPCIKTAMEGRQSPVSSRLHNFTGVRGDLDAIPVRAAEAGWPVHLYSDHTLDKLYGEFATSSINVEKAAGDPLEHDLSAFALAGAVLDSGDRAFVVLHTAGTDKAAHFKGVGTRRYFEHFRSVDASIKALAGKLDPKFDALLIFGDHGHDSHGGHTIGSLAFFVGDWVGLPAMPGIDQVDVYFFLAEALGLTLPRGYEGSFFYLESTPAGPREAAFAARQQAFLRAQGFSGDLGTSLDEIHSQEQARPLQTLLNGLPATLLWIWYYLSLLGALRSARAPGRRSIAILAAAACALALGSAGLGLLSVPLLLVPIYRFPKDADHRVEIAGIIGVLVAAGLSGLGMAYFNFFWEFSQDASLNLLIIYGGITSLGLLLSWWLVRAPDALPEMSGLVAALVLPSGAYFMNSGPNYFRGVLVGGGVLWLWRRGLEFVEGRPGKIERLKVEERHRIYHRARPGRAPRGAHLWRLSALFVLTCTWMQWDRSANWIWQFVPRYFMEQVAPWLAWLTVAIAAWTVRDRRPALILLAAGLIYSVAFAKLPMAVMASACLPLIVVGLWNRLSQANLVRRDGRWLRTTQPVLLALLALATAWIMFDSFDINHLDFAFGYSVFGALQTEMQRFVLYFLLGSIKYGLPIAAVVLAFRPAISRNLKWVILGSTCVLAVKVGFLLAQILAGVCLSRAHVYEVAVSEVAFVWFVGVILAFCAPLVRFVRA